MDPVRGQAVDIPDMVPEVHPKSPSPAPAMVKVGILTAAKGSPVPVTVVVATQRWVNPVPGTGKAGIRAARASLDPVMDVAATRKWRTPVQVMAGAAIAKTAVVARAQAMGEAGTVPRAGTAAAGQVTDGAAIPVMVTAVTAAGSVAPVMVMAPARASRPRQVGPVMAVRRAITASAMETRMHRAVQPTTTTLRTRGVVTATG